ncbi:MAG: hypothetical protein V4508_15530 [Pseudomonadota bacterium]
MPKLPATPRTAAPKPAKAAAPLKKAPPKPAAAPLAKPAAKVVAKPAAKPAAKPVAKKAPLKPAAAAAPAAVPEKARKPKLVRDSFTMPEQEYAVLGQVKKACIKAGFEIKKSELLRIGVALIKQIDMATLKTVLASLPQLKTGRPKSS